MSENKILHPKIPNDLILKLVKLSIDKKTDINTLIVNAIEKYTQANDILNNSYNFLYVSNITNNKAFILDGLENVINKICLDKVDAFFNSIILDLDETSKLKNVADIPNASRNLLNLLLTDKLLKQSILNPESATIKNALIDLECLADEGLHCYCTSLFLSETTMSDIVSLLDNSTINWLYDYRQKLIDMMKTCAIDNKTISELSALLYEILHFEETDTSAETADNKNDILRIAQSVSLLRNKDDLKCLLDSDKDATDANDANAKEAKYDTSKTTSDENTRFSLNSKVHPKEIENPTVSKNVTKFSNDAKNDDDDMDVLLGASADDSLDDEDAPF